MKRKKLLSLSILLLQFIPVASYADGTLINGICYNLNSTTKEAEVAKKEYKGDINIPATVNNKGTTYNVTSIGYFAFNENKELTSVTIPNSVNHISSRAFRKCTKLKSITIPKSVTRIDDSILDSCINITSIIVDKNNKIYDSRNNCNAIIHTETNELIQGCKNTTIPNTVTRIGDNAFYGMTTMKSIDIPNSVTTIATFAFWNCKGLTSLTIPNSVIYIGDFAFMMCENLKSVTLSQSLKSLQYYIFYECKSLTSITIPASVESCDVAAFCGCDNLKNIFFQSTTPPLMTETFHTIYELDNWGQNDKTTIHVPIGFKDTFMNDFYWKTFSIIEDVTIPENTTGIYSIGKRDIETSFFDLSGMRLSAPRKGINIINGKKSIIK